MADVSSVDFDDLANFEKRQEQIAFILEGVRIALYLTLG